MYRGKFTDVTERRIALFKRDEDGSLIIFSLFIFIAMLWFGGIAVDLMLHENKRTHLQNSADRAVLAATKFHSTASGTTTDPDELDPKDVVIDYMAKVGIDLPEDAVTVTQVGSGTDISSRRVALNVEATHTTMLMNLLGIQTLSFDTNSEAIQGNDVEISLVLDVSGSMGWNSKLYNMQNAAKTFVDDILENPDDNRVSISLVPYSTQVSAGPDLIQHLAVTHDHGYSHCVNFEDADFDTTVVQRPDLASGFATPPPIPLSQTAHFDPWRSWRSPMGLYWEVCRTEADFHITPWSNSPTALKNQIDGLTADGNTSIDVAVKWGTALLDPSMNPHLNTLIADPGVSIDAAFTVRPNSHTEKNAQKYIVVMTDGINTSQPHILPPFKTGPSDFVRRNSDGEIFMDAAEPGNRDGDGNWGENWYNVTHRNWENDPFGPGGPNNGNSQDLSDIDAFANMSMSWRAYAYYHQTYDADDFYEARDDTRDWVGQSTKNDRLSRICSAAKNAGIVVFTVGFEVTNTSADIMRNCASTPNHFYRVDGLDISVAFASIANQINQLKLVR